MKQVFENCDDIDFRKIKISDSNITILTVFVDGLVNEDMLNRDVIKALSNHAPNETYSKKISKETVRERLFTTSTEVEEKTQFNELINDILAGQTAVIVDGLDKGFTIDLREWESRGIEEPANEQSIKGPREGFTETIRFNTAQLRRRLKTRDFKIQHLKVGRQTKTDIAVTYCENIADPKVIEEVLNRVNKIDIDGVLESSYIQELIEERSISIFPEILDTERPDKVVGHLLEGKVAILTDNTPFALIVPVTMIEFFHTPEDYYNRYIFTIVQRLLRFSSFFVATCLPSLYILLTTFHYELIPVDIIFAAAQAREEVPFPPILEVVLIESMVEFLREASLRLPGPIGQTIGIVGALVIGDAAVDAELISPALVIFTAATMLGSFAIPNYSMASAVRLLRFPLLLMTGAFGGFGFVITWIIIAVHLCNFYSFGIPFLQPVAPLKASEQRDTIYRTPLRWMRKRPTGSVNKNVRRQKGVEEED
ncbi:spore germination protein [Natranaerobius trueperi]|uniref:spore germination protein n=1 Tax=Natranaerobius trueperi TaxID=759412 RepID=UPI0013039035|nr:spore germination protein [Natranaerobius trueperi]